MAKKRKPKRQKRQKNRDHLEASPTNEGIHKVMCPKHKNEIMHRLHYHITIYKKPTRGNRRGVTGKRMITNWFYCQKCDKARKVTYTVTK